MTTASIPIPPKLIPLFAPARGAVRYRCAYGGRGSAKSYTVALMAAVWGYAEPMRILCARELQVSIRESMHAEISAAIKAHPWLDAHYEIGEHFIRGRNGSEFLFRGLRHNISAIKSMSAIDLCIVEEAEDVPEASWIDLLPTIRAPRSEIWVVWNPRADGSPVDRRFRKDTPADALVVEMNWRDNPAFPDVLEAQRRHDQARMDPATYAHIWEGAYLVNSDAQVLAGKVAVREFEVGEGWDGPYQGLDFGFAQDPTAGVRCWIHDGALWVDYEAYARSLEIDATAAFLTRSIPGAHLHTTRADSARPESISYLQRHGLPRCVPVQKWPGSVEDGVAHLRSYREIVIHPRCRRLIEETRMYSYRVDRLTGDVMPQIVDAWNHGIDALRYALAPLIRRREAGVTTVKVSGL